MERAATEVPTLAEGALAGVADDMLVNFRPLSKLEEITQNGLSHHGGGVHFFRVREAKFWSVSQAKGAIGDVAGASLDISVASIVDPTAVQVQAYQHAMWTEYVSLQQNIAPSLIRSVPGGR